MTDNNNEVFFKIKKSTKLEKLMGAFCERQGKTVSSVRFLFEGQRVQPNDTPDTVSGPSPPSPAAPGLKLAAACSSIRPALGDAPVAHRRVYAPHLTDMWTPTFTA